MHFIFISVEATVQSKFKLMELQHIGWKWEIYDKQPMLGRTVIHFDHYTFLSLLKTTHRDIYKVIQMLKNIRGWFGKGHKNKYSNNIYQQYSIY